MVGTTSINEKYYFKIRSCYIQPFPLVNTFLFSCAVKRLMVFPTKGRWRVDQRRRAEDFIVFNINYVLHQGRFL